MLALVSRTVSGLRHALALPALGLDVDLTASDVLEELTLRADAS